MSETIWLATDDGAWRVRSSSAEPIGLAGKTLSLIVQQPDNENVLHAGAWEDGVYRATDGGNNWTRVLEADVWMLAQRSDRGELLYAGVEPAGVYRSSDYGKTWTELDAIYQLPTYKEWWFPPPPHIAHVTSFVLHPHDVKTVYAGVEVGGVIVSHDGGRTWAELHEGLHDDVHWMACSPNPHPNPPPFGAATNRGGDHSSPVKRERMAGGLILYAATAAGFYRSDDAGDSWHRSDRGMDRHYAYCVARMVGEAENLLLVAASGPSADDSLLFRSDNGGKAWQRAMNGLPASEIDGRMKIAAAPKHEGVCYVSLPDGILLRSDNTGESWSEVARGLPYVNGITVC